MKELENAQLQVLKEIGKATDAHCDIQVDDVDEIVAFLETRNFVAQKGSGWVITEAGRGRLEQEENVQRREQDAQAQAHTGKIQSWLSLAIASAALVISILALLSK